MAANYCTSGTRFAGSLFLAKTVPFHVTAHIMPGYSPFLDKNTNNDTLAEPASVLSCMHNTALPRIILCFTQSSEAGINLSVVQKRCANCHHSETIPVLTGDVDMP